ncbi:hypothetical+protein [Methylocapsa aurea]|uniref:GlsB/YeaQ/YmgE family stress response membrane protein n=1 Tax=Methylocapsa aurea TaxID=663610 RepID=UPI003D18D96A
MNEAIGFLGRPDAGFLLLAVIGALCGWLVGALLWASGSLFADMAVGVAGAWLGAQSADLCGLAVEGSIGHFLAGLLGSIIIVSLWARVDHPRASVSSSERR